MVGNVLVVLADQFRADCLGVAGNPDVETPVLDALARDGTYYPNSFCTAPLCTPSRYSLLTGELPRRHGVHDNNRPLAAELPTLPELVRPSGIRSCAVGKMHLTPTYLDVGFDSLVLAEQDGDGRLSDDYHRDLVEAGLVDGNDLIDQRQEYRARANERYWSSFGAEPSDLPEEWHSTTWTADRAIEQIDGSWASGGRLMYLSFVKPHHPFDPPRPWSSRYDPHRLTILPGWTPSVGDFDDARGYFDYSTLTEESLRRVMALYYAGITHLDFHLGRVLARLREVNAYDNTLVVFTSDHGEYLGFHHLLLKFGPMYDPVVRVPLLVKYPGRAACGLVDERLTSGIDLVPTALASLGVDASGLPGFDLADPSWDRSVVVAESRSEGQMARSRRHKLLMRPGREPVLFDLSTDPSELSPRPASGSAIGRALGAELDAALGSGPVVGEGVGGVRGAISPRTRSQEADRSARFDALLSRGHPWLDG